MATKSLYVGNLPYSVTESDLMSLFSAHGCTTARIVEGRGFGFVEVDETNMDAAISATNGTDMGGRSLVVNEARPKGEGGGGGGGNRSYSGGGGNRGGGGGNRRY